MAETEKHCLNGDGMLRYVTDLSWLMQRLQKPSDKLHRRPESHSSCTTESRPFCFLPLCHIVVVSSYVHDKSIFGLNVITKKDVSWQQLVRSLIQRGRTAVLMAAIF
jgi:hypothetical protein